MEHEVTPANRWWREPQVLWLILLVGGIFVLRIGDLNLQGEETRRAQVAAEMLWTGDWLVPRQQGEIYLSRPPLGSWLIAVSALVRGEMDAWAVRLPTVLAVLLTTLLIYGYARNFLSQSGALIAAAAYPTMAQVLQLGRLAESEGVFTLFIAGSLLVWHWGYLRNWPAGWMWSAGYVLAALAGLTKGPQGIAYFVGPVWFFLIVIERRGKLLLQPAHLVGLMAGIAAIAAWQIPYTLATSTAAGRAVWFTQASNRFAAPDAGTMARHLVLFPLEILACTLPWSLALVQLLNRNFWRSVAAIRSEVWFLLAALIVTFPTVWWAPFARGRYFMPLYPILAILAGLVLERCAFAARDSWMNRGWRQFLGGHAAAILLGSLGVCTVAFWPGAITEAVEFSVLLAVSFLVISLGAAVGTVFACRSRSAAIIQASILCLAGLLGFIYTGLIVSTQVARQPRVADLLSEVRTEIPPETTLISYGRVPHAFAYYYGTFIPRQPWPQESSSQPPAYFCFRRTDIAEHPLPFAWEPIAEMSFEDDDQPSPRSFVVIARRRPADPITAEAETPTERQ